MAQTSLIQLFLAQKYSGPKVIVLNVKQSSNLFKCFSGNKIDDGLAKCLLHIYIDSCHNLRSLDKTTKPSTKIELQMGQNDRQTTRVILKDTDPLFRQEFAFLVYNPCVDDLNIKVIDYDCERLDSQCDED